MIAISVAVSIFVAGALYAASNYFSATAPIRIELFEKCQDFNLGLPQVEQFYLKNLANRPWQIEISAFDMWGSGALNPSGVTLKWKLESVSQSFVTVELHGHEGIIGCRDYQKIDLPAGYEGILAFELTFTNAPEGNYSRLLSINIYDPQGEADVWEWQNTTSFAIT